MRIDITGYVTEPFVNYLFTIKVTSDTAEHPSLSFSDIQVEKEVRIFIPPGHYPSDYHTEFKTTEESESHRDKVNNCVSLGRALKVGDRVKCSVFIVESKTHNGIQTHVINRRSIDIKAYTNFDLWLYPDTAYFQRLEADSKESLKFRKQWHYTCRNREKYKKITGDTLYGYRDKKWVSKNPKIIFPILWWIRFRTAVSKLWGTLRKENNLTVALIITNIISILGNIILTWLLYLKNSN